ncbi:hypothetical protein Taro_040613 [Colocasia esculenta]|uniref:Essential protein Yae1 N-terminal domain-containing protein n=1 Tax=Colocasia esculenta TaxID=4460 RepID=A0A843WYS3_COLES|nr:hypothetical protein [Colocasia esculenta]
MGYRDGVIAGKEAAAQEGFNAGYKQAVLSGYNWGMVRGVTSALAGLPASLRDKLAATGESKDRLGRLYESVQSISSDDALKMFHEDMSSRGSKKPHSQAEESCSAEVSADEPAAGCGQLDNYLAKLESLTTGFPDVKLHWERKTLVHKE